MSDDVITMTPTMHERVKNAGVRWEGMTGGYAIGTAAGMFGALMYIALPKGHYYIGRDYADSDLQRVEVNGGLTFGAGNVFGWDYAHAYNSFDYDGDAKRALIFFIRMNNPLWRLFFRVQGWWSDHRWSWVYQLRRIRKWLSGQT